MSDLYERIETRSKEMGFKNVSELCIASGVPRSTLTELKKGRTSSISLATALKFSKTLDCSVEYLLGSDSSPAVLAYKIALIKRKIPGMTAEERIKAEKEIADLEVTYNEMSDRQENVAAVTESLTEKDMNLVRWFRSLPIEKQKAILAAHDAPEGLV